MFVRAVTAAAGSSTAVYKLPCQNLLRLTQRDQEACPAHVSAADYERPPDFNLRASGTASGVNRTI